MRRNRASAPGFWTAPVTGLLAAAFAGACGPIAAPIEAPPSGAVVTVTDGGPEPDGVRRYFQVVDGREILATHLIHVTPAPAAWHYAVRWEGGRVVRYEKINPAGRVVETVTVERSADGARRSVTRNGYGVEVRTDTVDAAGLHTRTWRSGVVADDGCYRKRREYSPAGYVAVEQCLDDVGTVIPDRGGCPLRRYSWTRWDDMEAEECLGEDRAPVADAQGVYKVLRDNDSSGRKTRESYLSPAGERVRRLGDGCAGMLYVRDKAGNVTETTCLGVGDQPQTLRSATYATVREGRDKNGCVQSREYSDAAGRATTKGRVSISAFESDEQCGVLVEAHLDEKDQLVSPGPRQPPRREIQRDAEGLPVSHACMGETDPQSCQSVEVAGILGSLVLFSHDDRGRLTRKRCFVNHEGNPERCDRTYPHEIRYEYGPDGRIRAESWADAKGNPALVLGAARLEYRYNAVGKITRESFLDLKGEPAENQVGFAELRIAYDEKQRVSTMEIVGVKGEPVASAGLTRNDVPWPDGSAKVVVERAAGTLSNAFYAPDGTLVRRVVCGGAEVPCYGR